MKRSKVLVLMLIASVILNITCFLPYIGGYYDRFKEKIFPTQYFKSNTIDSVVINAVVETSLKMDGSKFETRHPSLGLVPDVKLFLTNGGGVIRSNAKIIMRWHISMLDCHITL